jgi:hypothetical protein
MKMLLLLAVRRHHRRYGKIVREKEMVRMGDVYVPPGAATDNTDTCTVNGRRKSSSAMTRSHPWLGAVCTYIHRHYLPPLGQGISSTRVPTPNALS